MSNKLIKQAKREQKKKRCIEPRLVVSGVISVVLFMLAAILYALCRWAKETFNVSLNAIINTLTASLEGTSSDTVLPAVRFCLPYVLMAFLFSAGLGFWNVCRDGKRKNMVGWLLPAGGICALVGAFIYVQVSYDLIGYLLNKNAETSLYAEYYIDPRKVEITDNGQHRNLIYIYVESMENTYADVENGGIQDVNYIPNLTKLAKDNISFSNTDKLGGFLGTDGASWTMGALFSTTAGVPFEFPVGNNDMGKQEYFASGIYVLGDFLQEQGYRQEFLCGSNASFAGRRKYMEQHGDYKIFDLNTAREKGYIPKDYSVWWGYEDFKLYEIAKDELLALAAEPEPFNLTMLTVDTHHIGGYVCEKCPTTYEDETANVVSCADSQVAEFIAWCQKQDFYENTTIVITGDHPRMDNCLVKGTAYNDRMIYNCYINSVYDEMPQTSGRASTGMDVFPTVLSAMGYEIEGEQLGLGVNLFSGKETLVEKMGIDALNAELMKSSRYYMENFAPEMLHLIEDEFDALNIVCCYGTEYNAEAFITDGILAPQGIASWVIGDKIAFDIPVETKSEIVKVRLHIQETYNGQQSFVVYQNGQMTGTCSVPGNSVAEFEAVVSDGHCAFELLFPEAISPHSLDAANPDENKLSLLLRTITVSEVM